MSTILNNHINYVKPSVYEQDSSNGKQINALVVAPTTVEYDHAGHAHNLIPLMEVCKINYKNKFIRMAQIIE